MHLTEMTHANVNKAVILESLIIEGTYKILWKVKIAQSFINNQLFIKKKYILNGTLPEL